MPFLLTQQWQTKMKELIEQFIGIWTNYANMLSVQPCHFDIYVKIIHKLKNIKELDIEEKKTLMKMIELVADTIYHLKNGEDKYGIDYYQPSKMYDEPELNSCSKLLNHLESE